MSERANHQGRYQRTRAREWRQEAAPEDTAPTYQPDEADPETWGRTQSEARDLLRRQMCPVCGEGPWKSPLNHVAKRHGILKRELREACGLNSVESVVDPELRERFAERGRNAGRDMSEVARHPRKKYETTSAGASALARNLEGVTAEQRRAALLLTKTPEAQAKRSATLRAKWTAMTPAERRTAVNFPLPSNEEQARRSRLRHQQRGLQPCGTVAAYKRGCRCDACREAKRASRTP